VPNVFPPLPATKVADPQLVVSELVSEAIERSGVRSSQDVRIVVSTFETKVRSRSG
jgi:hypothetical protein